jgi:hypothetical protein
MSVRVPLDCPCYDVKKPLIILSFYLVFLVAYTAIPLSPAPNISLQIYRCSEPLGPIIAPHFNNSTANLSYCFLFHARFKS